MKKYRVAVAGLGARGRVHLNGFLENPDMFEVVGLYNPGQKNRDIVREKYGLNCFYESSEAMLEATRPDVLCFATHPEIRMEYIDLAVKYGVKAISMEKPFAVNMRDAVEIQKKCSDAGIKCVVSVQHKYYSQYQKMKKLVDEGTIGKITRVVAETTPWMHILGTHLVDYILWMTGEKRADWVVGHVSGKDKLKDNHVSPDFILGLIHFPDGLYANLECGYLSEPHIADEHFWIDNRLTVYGENGYIWGETSSRLGVCAPCTGGRLEITEEPHIGLQDEPAQVALSRDLYAWLEDDAKGHPCSLEQSMAAYEILTGLCLSGLDKRRVDIPMGEESYDVIERLKAELPEEKITEKFNRKGFFDHWGS